MVRQRKVPLPRFEAREGDFINIDSDRGLGKDGEYDHCGIITKVFKDKNGNFVEVPDVEPNSKQQQDIIRQYLHLGYTQAQPAEAMGHPVTTHSATEGTTEKNLKNIVASSMTDIKNTAAQAEKQVAAMPTVTSQDAGGIFNQFTNKLLASARQAQAYAGKQAPHQPVNTTPGATVAGATTGAQNLGPVRGPVAPNTPAGGSSAFFQPAAQKPAMAGKQTLGAQTSIPPIPLNTQLQVDGKTYQWMGNQWYVQTASGKFSTVTGGAPVDKLNAAWAAQQDPSKVGTISGQPGGTFTGIGNTQQPGIAQGIKNDTSAPTAPVDYSYHPVLTRVPNPNEGSTGEPRIPDPQMPVRAAQGFVPTPVQPVK